jgi:hypothetical protein
MIGPALFAKLSSDQSILDLTGNEDGSARIFPNYVREQDQVYPLMMYDAKDLDIDSCFDGDGGISTVSVTVRCIATNYDEAETLATALIKSLNNSSGTWGGLVVQGCFLDESGVTEEVIYESNATDTVLLLFKKEVTFNPIVYENPT